MESKQSMRVSFNTTNFGAKLIKTVTVQKFEPELKTYTPAQVSFVEIEPDNIKDTEALSTAADFWANEKYADVIAHTSRLLNMKILNRNKNKVYAITTQKENLSEPDDRKILGMAEIEDADKPIVELSHIQVKPAIIYALENPEYKYIGTSILNVLKSIYTGIKLTSLNDQSVINFYLKNGFRRIIPNTNQFIWQK